jgi:hypothetical protein
VEVFYLQRKHTGQVHRDELAQQISRYVCVEVT